MTPPLRIRSLAFALVLLASLLGGCGNDIQSPIGEPPIEGSWTKRDTIAIDLGALTSDEAMSYVLNDSILANPGVLLLGEANGYTATALIEFPHLGAAFSDSVIREIKTGVVRNGATVVDTILIVPVALDSTHIPQLLLRVTDVPLESPIVSYNAPLSVSAALVDTGSWSGSDNIFSTVPAVVRPLSDGEGVSITDQTVINLSNFSGPDALPIVETSVSIMLTAPSASESMVRFVSTRLSDFANLYPRLVVKYNAKVTHVDSRGGGIPEADTTITDTIVAQFDTYRLELTPGGSPPSVVPGVLSAARGRSIRSFVHLRRLTIPGLIDGPDTSFVVKDGVLIDSTVVFHQAILEVIMAPEGQSYALDKAVMGVRVLADTFNIDSAKIGKLDVRGIFGVFVLTELQTSEESVRRFDISDHLNLWLRVAEVNYGMVLQMPLESWGVESLVIKGMRIMTLATRPPDFVKPAEGGIAK